MKRQYIVFALVLVFCIAGLAHVAEYQTASGEEIATSFAWGKTVYLITSEGTVIQVKPKAGTTSRNSEDTKEWNVVVVDETNTAKLKALLGR